MSLGRLRQSQDGVVTQVCVVGVGLDGVSQVEAEAALAQRQRGHSRISVGYRWLGCSVYPLRGR